LRGVLADVAAGTPWAHDVKGKLLPRVKLCTVPLVDGACPGLVVGVVGSTTEQLRVLSRGASANLAVPADTEGVRAAVQAQVDALTREAHRTSKRQIPQGGRRCRACADVAPARTTVYEGPSAPRRGSWTVRPPLLEPAPRTDSPDHDRAVHVAMSVAHPRRCSGQSRT